MADLSIDIDCPKCHAAINVKLTELRPSGSKICPKCETNVKFSSADLSKVQKEIDKLEDTVRKSENTKR